MAVNMVYRALVCPSLAMSWDAATLIDVPLSVAVGELAGAIGQWVSKAESLDCPPWLCAAHVWASLYPAGKPNEEVHVGNETVLQDALWSLQQLAQMSLRMNFGGKPRARKGVRK